MDLRYILQQQEIDITDGLIKQMLAHIGSTDPELRDTFIYTRFQDWIIAKQLSQEQLNLVLASSLKNSLHRLGDSESDTVFARSFSVLLCALVLAYSPVTKDVYIRSFDVGRTYMEKEQDLRGHVEEKGWAHGIAHGLIY
ncbi:hypothetical protein JCM19046_764 [Bacillus sp. JCM 19046]|nr:hypothetical protein JCM19045_2382 [Bacillus sp. JCM 19045]GAF16336.1 hypothetical protein JCM19046_764 [Bacillus sp. JCM 19046]